MYDMYPLRTLCRLSPTCNPPCTPGGIPIARAFSAADVHALALAAFFLGGGCAEANRSPRQNKRPRDGELGRRPNARLHQRRVRRR